MNNRISLEISMMYKLYFAGMLVSVTRRNLYQTTLLMIKQTSYSDVIMN